jgi:hypothetical protein
MKKILAEVDLAQHLVGGAIKNTCICENFRIWPACPNKA